MTCRPLPHKVEGIHGDITAAVFIAGDEGDAVEIFRMTGTGMCSAHFDVNQPRLSDCTVVNA
jgi:hypothetical protein